MYKYISLIIIILGLFTCAPRHESFECDDESRDSGHGKIFLTGPEMLNSEHFTDILKMSGIHSEGYTLIITGEKNTDASYIKRFNEMLNFNKLHANHIIGISDTASVTPANQMAIENARLIFLAFGHRDFHHALLNDELFIASFLKAWKSGATIVAIASSPGILGDEVVVLPEKNDEGNKRYATRTALGLLPGVIIDKSDFYENQSQWITDLLKDKEKTFLGLGNYSMIQVCGSEIVVIEPGSMVVIRNNKPVDQSNFTSKSKISLN